MKRHLEAAIISLALVALPHTAPAATQFLAYEGRDAVQEGQGGNKKVVDGVDFWIFGAPPHRFQILGMLEDERWKSGIYGLIRVSNLEHDIAKSVRAAGGDAVILQDQHDKTWGMASSSFGGGSWSGNGWGGSWSGSSFSTLHPYGTKESLYVVVKYLPDETPTTAAPAITGAPSADAQAEPPAPSGGAADANAAAAPAAGPIQSSQAAPRCGALRQKDGSLRIVPC